MAGLDVTDTKTKNQMQRMIQAAPAAAFVPHAPLNAGIEGCDVLVGSHITEHPRLKGIMECNPKGREV